MKCTNCGNECTGKFCDNCGQALQTEISTIAQKETEKRKQKTRPCNACGHTISVKAKKCPSCGEKNKRPLKYRGWFKFFVFIVFTVLFVSLFSMIVATISEKNVEKRFDEFVEYMETYGNYSNGEYYMSFYENEVFDSSSNGFTKFSISSDRTFKVEYIDNETDTEIKLVIPKNDEIQSSFYSRGMDIKGTIPSYFDSSTYISNFRSSSNPLGEDNSRALLLSWTRILLEKIDLYLTKQGASVEIGYMGIYYNK